MNITLTMILRGIYHITVAIIVLGFIINIMDNETDIYQVWAVSVFLIGSYLIEREKLA